MFLLRQQRSNTTASRQRERKMKRRKKRTMEILGRNIHIEMNIILILKASYHIEIAKGERKKEKRIYYQTFFS